MSTILIAGGTGLIGMHLSRLLHERGHTVLHLSRTRDLTAEFPQYEWDVMTKTVDTEAIEQADIVVNLAGAGIADKRWTEERKQLIIDSRVEGAKTLEQHFRTVKAPRAYIASSAIGYYGDRGEEILTERSGPGEGFLSQSCVLWEQASRGVGEVEGVRLAIIRTGIVLALDGGALSKMLPPFKLRVGNYFGDGEMYYSWIHIHDLCRIFVRAIEDEGMSGIYNAVGPNPTPNKAFAKGIREALPHGAVLIPVPEKAIQLAMGEMSHVVLDSTRVIPARLAETGFTYDYPHLVEAMKALLEQEGG